MVKVGTKFSIGQILPMCGVNKSLIINGDYYPKSRTLKMVARQGIVCSICGEKATHFQYYATQNSQYPVIRLMFEHVTDSGYPAFMTIDHIIPTHLGGPNTVDNIQVACNVCNSRKGHNLEYVPSTPQKKLDWKIKLIYIAYIRWYIKTFYSTISTRDFIRSKRINSEIRRNIAAVETLHRVEFDVAWNSVVGDIVSALYNQKVVDLFDVGT
jgi:hypothetical protein